MDGKGQYSVYTNKDNGNCDIQSGEKEEPNSLSSLKTKSNTLEANASNQRCLEGEDDIPDMASLKINCEVNDNVSQNETGNRAPASEIVEENNNTDYPGTPKSDVNSVSLGENDVNDSSTNNTKTNDSLEEVEGIGNSEKQGKVISNDNDSSNRKIFVGTLACGVTRKELREIFSKYGEVVHATISLKSNKFKSDNYGFVTFSSPEEAERALAAPKDELKLHKRKLKVAPANQKHQPGKDKPVKPRSKHYQNKKCIQSSDTGLNDDEINNTDFKQEGDVASNGEFRITDLNEYCLIHIFSFLPIKDRVRLERVCKLWQRLLQVVWARQKHLRFNHLRGMSLNTTILCDLLKKCRNLVSLDFSHVACFLHERTVPSVAKYCGTVQKMNLQNVPMHSYGIRAVGKHCFDLRWINLENCAGIKDKDIETLFQLCQNLETVNLSGSLRIPTRCFSYIPKNVKEVILNNCRDICFPNLVEGLKRLPKLRNLVLDSCSNLSEKVVFEICENAPGLQVLSMANARTQVNSWMAISKLKNLKTLGLHMNYHVDDDFLEALSKECLQLKALNISGFQLSSIATCVTDRGFYHLSKLPHLVVLVANYLEEVSDRGLVHLSSRGILRKLACRKCNFTDFGCSRLISSCPDLTTFDVSYCRFVSSKTVGVALNSVEMRTKPVKLALHVSGTSVSNLQYRNEHPLLVLKRSSLSFQTVNEVW